MAQSVVVYRMCELCNRTGPPEKTHRVNCEKKLFYINFNHINIIIFSYPKLKEATSTVNMRPLSP